MRGILNKQYMDSELLRTIILVMGWPVLIVGSVFLIYKSYRFYRDVQKTVVGKLVIAMVTGWLISMYSLGIVATAYMVTDVQRGVSVVLPIFIVWFVTMGVITFTVLRWSKEAVTLNAFYRTLEQVVQEKTEALKRAYELQLHQEREIRQLREKFVFIAAHELRAPITTLRWGLSSLLGEESFIKAIAPEHLKIIENLQEKNDQLTQLIEDLLSVARIQSKTISIVLEDVKLGDIFSAVKDNVAPLAAHWQVTVSWPEDGESSLTIKSNPIMLKEVLTNLVSNAIKYNKPGGWVAVAMEHSAEELRVHVKDGGIGMTPEEMGKLFQEFYRVATPETRDKEGTGLGLFISKKLIEQMRGRIWVQSVKGQGSTFSFTLPLSHTIPS